MPSQEDYLDELLKNLEKEGQQQTDIAGADEGTVEIPVETPESEDISDILQELPESADFPQETAGTAELPESIDDILGLMDTENEFEDISAEDAGLTELLGENGQSEEEISGVSAEDPDLEELLRSFEESAEMPIEESAEIPVEKNEELPVEEPAKSEPSEEPAAFSLSGLLNEEEDAEVEEASSMSEDDIERILAENREAAKSDTVSPKEEFQGDVVDLLQGTDDSELQEIQDLLEKSDNNEAVGSEIEALLQGNAHENYQDSVSPFDSEADGGDAQLTPKQQKALEKKRLKEEKAAAKKAAKEAKRAEKEAKKAAKKTGKAPNIETDNAPETDPVASAEENGAGGMTEEPIDTAFLDSILSEANKITSAENISSATGNYNAKVGKIMQDEGEDSEGASQKKGGAVSSGNDSFGIDVGDLFGDGASADSSLADLPDFEALDGGDVTGIMELAGEGEEEAKPKKKGFFSRFLEFLTEEEEEEEENEDIKLSEENQEIIEELDKEKKDKKGKKGKKKAKKADASAEDGEEGEEGEEGKGKKGKKKKEKKPKKEKLPKEEEPVEPGKKLGLKKVLPVLLFCFSLGAVIIIITFVSVDSSDKKAAKDAFYDGDYLTCYQNLFGKDLDETEQVMYGKSESVLRIRLWLREYEWYVAEGKELEALDSLIQSVNEYPPLYEYATQWNAAGEVAQEYSVILNVLYEKYGLTEDQARAIAAEPDDIEYTRQVNAIVQGGAYGSWNEPEPVEEGPLPDELPEETDLPEGNFIDTNSIAQ